MIFFTDIMKFNLNEIILLGYLIYIIKQDIRKYVPYSRPNGWTDWAEIFCGHSGVAGG